MQIQLLKMAEARQSCFRNIAVICADYGFEPPSYLTFTREGMIVIWQPHSFRQQMTSLPWIRGFARLWGHIVRFRENRKILKDWIVQVYQERRIIVHITPMGHLYVSCSEGLPVKDSVLHQWVAAEKAPYRTSFIPWRR